jgi:hypothetical protein
MANLQPTIDVTGDSNQIDRNTQDIAALMNEINISASAINRTVTGFDIYYDNTGLSRIYIGQAPIDGRIGIWVSKPGQDVKTLLGG